MDDQGRWWVRAEVKGHHDWPTGYRHVEHDPVTGQDVGWVPLDKDDPAHDWIADAVLYAAMYQQPEPGTFEAVGGQQPHLVRHGCDVILNAPRTFNGLQLFCELHPEVEGLVWWVNGVPVAKVRRLDLGLPWPAPVSAGEQRSSRSPSGDTLPPSVADSPAGSLP